MAKVNVNMPKLGMSMTEGEIARWVVSVGDKVAKGDEIVEITENKATHTIQALAAGTVSEIRVQEGETVGVGDVIAVLDEE